MGRWLFQGFGSVGKARIRRTIFGWIIETIVEGAPMQDPMYIEHVRMRFQATFVERGFGPFATSSVRTKLLAGNPYTGKAREQWVEIPTIRMDEV